MKPFPRFYRLPVARFPWSSLITPLIVLAASTSCNPRPEESHTEPFGVFLGLETAKLWHEFEARYGRPVRTERPPELETNAEAVVKGDGILTSQ